MTRAGFLCSLACLVLFAQTALCQQAPQLVTFPSPPTANQPFAADVYLTVPLTAHGFTLPPTQSGNIIVAQFDFSCVFTCPPQTAYVPYRLSLPALPAGNYTLRIVAMGSLPPATPDIADFPLAVAAAPMSPAPANDLMMLLLLLVGLVLSSKQHFLTRSRTHP